MLVKETPIPCFPDPMLLLDTISEITRHNQELLSGWLTEVKSIPLQEMKGMKNISDAFVEMYHRLLNDPAYLGNAQMALWQGYLDLFRNSAMTLLDGSGEKITPDQSDRRFRDNAWNDHFLFDFIKQAYLLNSRWLLNTVTGLEGMDEQAAKKIDFYTRQYIDAVAPTNFAATNPAVLRKSVETGGQNILNGLKNMLEDMKSGNGRMNIRMTDLQAFELGSNIATTPGKVVYQNDLIQLIQYQPATESVYRRPLLIVPPWINKYYILDLQPKNSFIKWAVDQGHTVFVISWTNPDASLAGKEFDDYMLEGPLAALDAIEKATGEDEINAIGYCLGGTLLASTMAYMAAKGDDRIKSGTCFTTMTDFEEVGEIGVFIDDIQLTSLEQKMKERGYLCGSEMATSFNMLRANDLIWSFFINNYLLGEEPAAFDLLYWNSDSTRMPSRMHSFYLRNMYLNNRLREPGGISLAGQPIDLREIRAPMYFVSTVEDHIAPWKSTYSGARLPSGEVHFVLGGSGHIAGIVNPPEKNKYGYWTNDTLEADPDQWLKKATQHQGSWWLDWDRWIREQADERVAPRIPGDGQLLVIEDAPGSYVRIRSHDC
jgi:polyhydroxyalkanoate synthase